MPLTDASQAAMKTGYGVLPFMPRPWWGRFVLFPAGLSQAALDRLSAANGDPNSMFTRKLLTVLRSPSVTHIDLAKRVQKEVADLAATINHQQQPAYYDQIIGEVVINPQ